MHAFLEDEAVEPRPRCAGRGARRDARPLDHAGAVRLRLQEQGRPAAARRDHRLPAVAARRPAGQGIDAAHRATRSTRGADARRAVRRPRLQGHDRPVRRQAHLLPGLLGHAQGGLARATTRRSGKQGARRPHPADAREPPRGARGDRRRRDRRRRRPQADDDRRHAGRPSGTPVLLESIVFPEPVIEVAVEPKTKADQDKLAHGARAALRGGPDLPRHAPTRRPARRSSPAWASCTSRSSSTA